MFNLCIRYFCNTEAWLKVVEVFFKEEALGILRFCCFVILQFHFFFWLKNFGRRTGVAAQVVKAIIIHFHEKSSVVNDAHTQSDTAHVRCALTCTCYASCKTTRMMQPFSTSRWRISHQKTGWIVNESIEHLQWHWICTHLGYVGAWGWNISGKYVREQRIIRRVLKFDSCVDFLRLFFSLSPLHHVQATAFAGRVRRNHGDV